MTTDDLLPLSVFVILQANPRHIEANIQYMEHFHAPTPTTSELSFHFATFRAAYQVRRFALIMP